MNRTMLKYNSMYFNSIFHVIDITSFSDLPNVSGSLRCNLVTTICAFLPMCWGYRSHKALWAKL